MKNSIFYLSLAIFLFTTTPAFAVTSTSSATTQKITVTATPAINEETVNSNLQDRVKEIIQEKLSSSEAQIKDKVSQISLVGYTGKVSAVTSSSITLDTQGEIFQIATTETTQIISANQKIKLSSIAIGDKVIVIGNINVKKDIITAKRIVVIKESTPSEPTKAAMGTIASIDKAKRTFTLKSSKETLSLLLARKANLKIDELVIGKQLFVIIRPQEAGQVVTKAKIL